MDRCWAGEDPVEDRARELAAEVHDEPRPEEPDEDLADDDSVSSRMTPSPARRQKQQSSRNFC